VAEKAQVLNSRPKIVYENIEIFYNEKESIPGVKKYREVWKINVKSKNSGLICYPIFCCKSRVGVVPETEVFEQAT
jgi:hypothetical protein